MSQISTPVSSVTLLIHLVVLLVYKIYSTTRKVFNV